MKSNWSFFVMHLVSFKNIVWNSLVMQWLGFGTATAVATVWSPVARNWDPISCAVKPKYIFKWMKDKTRKKKKKNTVKHDLCMNSYLEVQFKYKLKKFSS